MQPRVPGHVLLTLKVRREEDQYVSECIELGVGSCGKTIDEAFAAVKDATSLYLQTLYDEGELEPVVGEPGVAILPGEPQEDGRGIQITARPGEYVPAEPLPVPISA